MILVTDEASVDLVSDVLTARKSNRARMPKLRRTDGH
jgi:hypothetical protein